MEKVKMVGLILMLGLVLGSVVAVQGARELTTKKTQSKEGGVGGEVEQPQNIYGGVGGVGGVVPGEGGGGQPVVVSGGTSFYCPYPGIAACTITVHPALPGGGGGVGGVTNP